MTDKTWVPLGNSSIYGFELDNVFVPPSRILSPAVSIPMNTKWITKESSEDNEDT